MRRLREETASMEQANMQIGPEQGQFMALLVEFSLIDEVSVKGIDSPIPIYEIGLS